MKQLKMQLWSLIMWDKFIVLENWKLLLSVFCCQDVKEHSCIFACIKLSLLFYSPVST